MEYSQSYSSSSSTIDYPSSYPQVEKSRQPSQQSHLHSVRKPPAKPWKKLAAPVVPNPPRVYQVKPVDFKSLVQQLTGVQEPEPRRLQSVAPPPLSLKVAEKPATLELLPSPLSSTFHDLMNETLDGKPWKLSDSFGATSPLGFSLSPSWCNLPLLSPGTLSSLDQTTVL